MHEGGIFSELPCIAARNGPIRCVFGTGSNIGIDRGLHIFERFFAPMAGQNKVDGLFRTGQIQWQNC